MWNELWNRIIDNHIFHTVIILSVLFLVFFPGRLYKIFGKFKKVKAGSFELQTGDETDPDTPCPYKKSRDESFGAIRKVESEVDKVKDKMDKLSEEMREVISIVKTMSVDQQKQTFYDLNQPDAERLAGGLKYIYQGGNGFTKPDVVKFAGERKDLYNALTRVNPELRLITD